MRRTPTNFFRGKFGGSGSSRRSSLDLGAGLNSLSNLASELEKLEDDIDRMRNRNRVPYLQFCNFLGVNSIESQQSFQ